MAKKFTEQEREKIKLQLIMECDQMWTIFGYKKTNIDEICRKVGLSKGAFYLFFASKELLFWDVIKYKIEGFHKKTMDILEAEPNKNGWLRSIKLLFREYDQGNWLKNITSSEFQLLITRSPERAMEELKEHETFLKEDMLQTYGITLRVPVEDMMLSIQALFLMLLHKEQFQGKHIEIFDGLIEALFEKNVV
ncbi:TetR/AcrR family transcriptional regulator [Viridibacillus sp. YIM B01967]|uniref:TetR/AcrR family transcriptional regulator n=1 Tax=Viridibacillus soli TaxID=2798301 RepID=A0ABS1H6M2_9BACL|nr:TetR/AcrR family transcriptional regulator [Viridibacillus soli]MBK3495069.1 TetR/AcrR family transcriptional regulator [Viridibacillus soli]